jgi:NAD(P)H-hydrate epimerase
MVMTPHPGEAAAMLECSTAEVQGDRFATVEALQKRFGGVALLKGAGTLVYDGEVGRIIARGTPYLATGGSGDVLSGIIAACLSRGLSACEAAVAGAYIHAVAGEKASTASGGPIIASDIAWAAASVFGDLEK